MFIADELVKILICELCIENYNEKEKLPLSLYPCGHTYCSSCFNNLNTKTCPCCKKEIETTLKNWAIINIIPKPKFPQIYHDLKDTLTNGVDLLNHFDNLNKQIDLNWNDIFEKIKIDINSKVEELIGKIKEMQFSLLERLNKHENDWLLTYKQNLEFEKELNTKCHDINLDLNKDDINIDEIKLNEFKLILDDYLLKLNEKINFLEMNYLNNKLSFLKSKFNLNDGKLYNENFVIGELLLVENDALNNDEEERNQPSTPTKFKTIVETYSEIESTIVEKIINKLPLNSNEDNSSNLNKCCIQKTYQIVRKIRQIKENFYVLAANQQNSNQEDTKSSNIDVSSNKKDENNQAEKTSNDNLFIFQVESNLLNSNDQLNKENFEDENKIVNENIEQSSIHSSLNSPMPRYCKLKRSSKSEFYGFDLKTYKKDIKHMIINIINDSPAQKAGLIEGDIILEVNGESVDNADRDAVVKKIIKHSKHVELLVVNDYKIYLESKDPTLNNGSFNNSGHHFVKNSGTLPILNNRSNRTSTISSTQNIEIDNFNGMSRIITITHEKDLKYLGFSVKKRKTGPHIIAAVEKDSPAGKAGLKVNDLLLRLNSVNLIGKSYLKTVDLLKKETIAGGSFQLEVIESDLCPLKIRNRSLSTNSLDIDKAEQHINYDSSDSELMMSNQNSQNDLDKINNEKVKNDDHKSTNSLNKIKLNNLKISSFVKRIKKSRKNKHNF